jgi:hypothetical protein
MRESALTHAYVYICSDACVCLYAYIYAVGMRESALTHAYVYVCSDACVCLYVL